MDRILIVEDESVLSRNVANYLRREGLNVETAESGARAREILRAGNIGMLCLDIGLPDCDGLDLLREIRADHPGLPAIVISANDTPINRNRARDLNISGFLEKPFALSTLRSEVMSRLDLPLEFHRDGDGAGSDMPAANVIRGPSGDDRRAPSTDRGPATIMMYSPDGIGLGHMRRNSNIARRLVETRPGINVVMLVGSPTGAFFDLPAGTDCIKLPSIRKVATNAWQSRSLHLSVDIARSLRGGLIAQAARILRPSVFLVDHVPAGVWGELMPTLEMFRNMADGPQVVLGLRDILDAPEVIRDTWRRQGLHDLVDRYYDAVMIYGQKDVFPAAATYGLAENRRDKFRYCGYVCSDEPCNDAAQVRQRLGIGDEKLIVVTAGGGADAFPMMAATMEALKRFDGRDRATAIFITGPLMNATDRLRLRQAAAGRPIRVLDTVPDVPDYLNAADLVITMAGYNSLVETLRTDTPAIVIPRRGPSAEQSIRSRLFDKLGLVRHIGIDDCTPDALSELIRNVMSSGDRRSEFRLSLDGLDSAARHLLELMKQGDPPHARVDPNAGHSVAGLNPARTGG